MRAGKVTIVPVINDTSEIGPPLFVLKGKRIPYHQVVVDGAVQVETYTQCFACNARVVMREENGGVDSENFLNRAHEVSRSMSDLTASRWNVLIAYDAYSAHMSLAVLLILHAHRIVVCPLPAYTSAKTQPLDAVAFSGSKHKVNSAITRTVQNGPGSELNMYE